MFNQEIEPGELWKQIRSAFVSSFKIRPLSFYANDSFFAQFLSLYQTFDSTKQKAVLEDIIIHIFSLHANVFLSDIAHAPDLEIFKSISGAPFFIRSYETFLKKLQKTVSEIFNVNLMERTITLRLIEDFSSDVVISSRIKDQLVKLVRNDRFTQDYIDAVLTQSSDILHILLRDISVLQQCLGNLSIWSVTVPQIKEPSEGIREAPLNSLIEYQARLCEVLKIEAPDLDRFLTRQPTADSVDLVTPTFSFPDYLIMSIYFGVSGGKSWLFQRLYAELKSEKLFSSSPLSTPKSDAEVIGITIDQFKLLMETLRDEFRELFSSTDFNFRQLERFWIATREESGAQEEDEKTIENATSRKKMQRFSSFHSVVFADQICLIAQCKVFGYEDVSNDAALQATIQAMLRAKHLRHILQVMQTCSSFLQQIHCSMKAEKIMIDSRRETDIDLLKKFCLSKLATFSSIKVVEVPFILDYIFRIASPLDPESSSHLLFLQKICSNIAIGVFLF